MDWTTSIGIPRSRLTVAKVCLRPHFCNPQASYNQHFALSTRSMYLALVKSAEMKRPSFNVLILAMFVSLSLWPALSEAQTTITYFEKTYGGGEAKCIIEVEDTSGNKQYMVAGTVGGNIALMKTTVSGTPIWRKTYGGPAIDEGNALIQTPDGGYAIVGTSFSFTYGIRNILVLKVDGNGILEWSRSIGGDSLSYNDSEGLDIILSQDSNLVICGSSHAFGDSTAAFIAKIHATTGSTIWFKKYSSILSGMLSFASINLTSDGGFTTAIMYATGAGGPDMGIAKFDCNGSIQWSKSYGGSQEDWITSLALASDGYVLVGRTKSFGASGYSDVFAVKTDFNGLVQWAEIVGDSNFEVANSVQISNVGEIIISGFVADSISYDHNAYFLSLGSDGIPEWINKIDNATNSGDYLYSTLITNDGYLFSGTENGHLSILKVDGQGSNVCEQAIAINYSNVTPVVGNYPLTTLSVIPTIIYPTITLSNWTSSVTTHCLNIVTSTAEVVDYVIPIVFPNPARDQITVRGEEGDVFRLYDALGQCVMDLRLHMAEQLIPVALPAGMYLHSLGEHTGKLIIE